MFAGSVASGVNLTFDWMVDGNQFSITPDAAICVLGASCLSSSIVSSLHSAIKVMGSSVAPWFPGISILSSGKTFVSSDMKSLYFTSLVSHNALVRIPPLEVTFSMEGAGVSKNSPNNSSRETRSQIDTVGQLLHHY